MLYYAEPRPCLAPRAPYPNTPIQQAITAACPEACRSRSKPRTTRGGQSVSAMALTLTDCVQFADGKNTHNLDKPSLRAAFIERNAPRNLGRMLMSIFSVFCWARVAACRSWALDTSQRRVTLEGNSTRAEPRAKA